MIAQILRTLIDIRKPTTQDQCNEIGRDGLAIAMHTTRASAHSQLDYLSPAFNPDIQSGYDFEYSVSS